MNDTGGSVEPPVFMSSEHVASMNDRLASSAEVRAICGDLDGPLTLAFELTDGPGGEVVYWTLTFTDTATFSLEPAVDADVVLHGDWTHMVRATVHPGTVPTGPEGLPDGIRTTGDPSLLQQLMALLAAIGPHGVVPMTLPTV